jgi:UDP-N-acetylglucosamine 2-epimerase (non-hydrolysing)
MKIAFILGTRPEIIKLSPIIKLCQQLSIPFCIVHTGQHYSENMDAIFFRELGLPQPTHNLGLGGLPFHKQIALYVKGIITILREEKPDVVLVQGDTNSVVAGAFAATRLGIPVGHVEAGLRSFDTTMIEEINRVSTDHLSTHLFAPTAISKQYLLDEGKLEDEVSLVGNTIADVVLQHQETNTTASTVLQQLDLQPRGYILITAHRAENVDRRDRLAHILQGLKDLRTQYPDLALVFPMHPRTKQRIADFGLLVPEGVRVIDPVGYIEMIHLQQHAQLIITDSGGIQEEACILHVPVVTLRDNTERPETVEAGCNILVPGLLPEDIVKAVSTMLHKQIAWTKPYGDGQASVKIINELLMRYSHD